MGNQLQDTGRTQFSLTRTGFVAVCCVMPFAVSAGTEVTGPGSDNLCIYAYTTEANHSEVSASDSGTSTVHAWLRFRELADKWRIEQGPSSSMTWITSRPSYLKIIAMGDLAIPFLLQELRHQPDHWFTALRAITGENPVRDEVRGNLRKMAAAWIQWGIENGRLEA
jgi:hypothetical protein